MTERTLAEWEMKGQDERAPWQDNAGWPFVKPLARTSEFSETHEDEIANLYDALDCDTPLPDAFNPETKTNDKVEMLAEVLLTFLSSTVDGVITRSLWERLEESMATREKSKQPVSLDDEKMSVLEILTAAPSHSASFLLFISFLQNISNQITEASKPKPDAPRSSVELPASPETKVRRKTLSKVPEEALRQLIVRNYAVLFADPLFRHKEEGKMKEKEKAVRKERMVRIIQIFLDGGAASS